MTKKIRGILEKHKIVCGDRKTGYGQGSKKSQDNRERWRKLGKIKKNKRNQRQQTIEKQKKTTGLEDEKKKKRWRV